MSYCVNCGVKLDPSLKYCPLCNTPVINPHDLSKMQPVSPFPKEKGQVEVVRRKDLAILLSVSLTAAGLCSLLLNCWYNSKDQLRENHKAHVCPSCKFNPWDALAGCASIT